MLVQEEEVKATNKHCSHASVSNLLGKGGSAELHTRQRGWEPRKGVTSPASYICPRDKEGTVFNWTLTLPPHEPRVQLTFQRFPGRCWSPERSACSSEDRQRRVHWARARGRAGPSSRNTVTSVTLRALAVADCWPDGRPGGRPPVSASRRWARGQRTGQEPNAGPVPSVPEAQGCREQVLLRNRCSQCLCGGKGGAGRCRGDS